MTVETLFEGDFLRLQRRTWAHGHWEYVERANAKGVAVIVPITDDDEIVLVEQHRPPLQANVIELPAGLVADKNCHSDERIIDAARRELLEETGYTAQQLTLVFQGPPSPGMTNEIVHFYLARGLLRQAAGGGDATESIQIHRVPLCQATAWIAGMAAQGVRVDPKVFIGLWFGCSAT